MNKFIRILLKAITLSLMVIFWMISIPMLLGFTLGQRSMKKKDVKELKRIEDNPEMDNEVEIETGIVEV